MSPRATAAALAALAALIPAAAGCGEDDDAQQSERTTPGNPPARTPTATTPPGREPVRAADGAEVETIATGLEAPWELAFLPDGRALVTERPGRVRLMQGDGTLRAEPVAEIDVEDLGEGGLLGVAVDPRFDANRFVYLYRTFSGNQVVRYRFTGRGLEEETVLVEGIAASSIHNGGRLNFGPDDQLYFSAGDAAQDTLAQEPGSLGKILRLTPAQYRGGGGQPEVFSLGHRNPQGFDWEPGSGRLVSDEHGPDGDDEVNVINQGANYGWPLARGEDHGEFQAPVAVYEDSIAPSGGTFVSLPGSEWSGDYLFAALVGEQIRRVRLDKDGRVVIDEAMFEGDFGRLRTVVEGPDGALYALTNNTDGRGSPHEGDDRILRIVPPAG